MSLFDIFTKKNKLSSAIKQVALARKSDAGKANQLYKQAYQSYAEILTDHPLLAETLYNWGFALLHEAKAKPVEEAESLYEEAIAKFSFCIMLSPNYLGAAIDSGVAWMDLARLKGLPAHDQAYDRAKAQFELANAIQNGPACYNLACIYSLRGDQGACQSALEDARDKGSLPDLDDIIADPDLANVKSQAWFSEFLESVKTKKVVVDTPAVKPAAETIVPAEPEAAPAEASAADEELAANVEMAPAEDIPEHMRH
ncbi:MAG: hypothetical protein WC782_13665 [Methylococcaceae bacterium]|jgi:tetratricopeptide (TPR) repeat protein